MSRDAVDRLRKRAQNEQTAIALGDMLRAVTAERDQLAAALEAAREALEEIRGRSTLNGAMNPNPYELTTMLGDIHQIADAALAAHRKREESP